MIESAAVKIVDLKTDETVIIPCHRHNDAYDILHMLRTPYEKLCEGFLDDHNMFLTRLEAMEDAKSSKQLIVDVEDRKLLYTEDLW